jgi:hypothetical protein
VNKRDDVQNTLMSLVKKSSGDYGIAKVEVPLHRLSGIAVAAKAVVSAVKDSVNCIVKMGAAIVAEDIGKILSATGDCLKAISSILTAINNVIAWVEEHGKAVLRTLTDGVNSIGKWVKDKAENGMTWTDLKNGHAFLDDCLELGKELQSEYSSIVAAKADAKPPTRRMLALHDFTTIGIDRTAVSVEQRLAYVEQATTYMQDTYVWDEEGMPFTQREASEHPDRSYTALADVAVTTYLETAKTAVYQEDEIRNTKMLVAEAQLENNFAVSNMDAAEANLAAPTESSSGFNVAKAYSRMSDAREQRRQYLVQTIAELLYK